MGGLDHRGSPSFIPPLPLCSQCPAPWPGLICSLKPWEEEPAAACRLSGNWGLRGWVLIPAHSPSSNHSILQLWDQPTRPTLPGQVSHPRTTPPPHQEALRPSAVRGCVQGGRAEKGYWRGEGDVGLPYSNV